MLALALALPNQLVSQLFRPREWRLWRMATQNSLCRIVARSRDLKAKPSHLCRVDKLIGYESLYHVMHLQISFINGRSICKRHCPLLVAGQTCRHGNSIGRAPRDRTAKFIGYQDTGWKSRKGHILSLDITLLALIINSSLSKVEIQPIC